MQTRRDHVQAYQFAVGRLATSLVTGDPGRGTSPTRRGSLGAFFGVLLVVLLCAGSGVYGLIKPVQKDTWRQPGSIIVEKETGSRYLLVGGTLRPVLNYASALLLTGSSGTVRTVSRDVLAPVPHGSAIGIAGAPDALPAAADVLSGGWARCLRPGAPAGEILDLGPPRTLPAPGSAQAVLAGPKGELYVLWQGVKYPVPAADATLIALGLDSEQRIAAPRAWLARVPSGTALTAPAVPHAGTPAGRVAGHAVRVGQLFRTPAASGGHTYVLLADGIAPVTPTELALLAARRGAAPVLTIDATTLAGATLSRSGLAATGLPDVLHAPAVDTAGADLCLRQVPAGRKLTSTVVLEHRTAGDDRTVRVPPGHGVLAVDQDQVAAGAAVPQPYLVDDQGTLFPLGQQAASALQLSGPTTPMPADVLSLLPRGPVLDGDAAAATVKEG
ncbi:type VII secretion protein EccB [Streptomyces hyaluromycini]|uniref:type VII secretion protein EccB n=1 Tax=Streptomyces hyaluromycini TaxID=1377993 RepID=UPI00142E2556|nr:type VII secretion protein EccB [Streptomyces hyaluromycini]